MWPDASQTIELLDRAGQGDAEAVNGLLEHHRTALRRMIELRLDRRVQQRVDASDVVQEVLVEASRRLSEYLATRKLPFIFGCGRWLATGSSMPTGGIK